MPSALLERPPASHDPSPTERCEPRPAAAGAGPPPRGPRQGGGGGWRWRRGRSEQYSIWFAALVTALIGSLFTFLGILTQIWANMAGSQLPGA